MAKTNKKPVAFGLSKEFSRLKPLFWLLGFGILLLILVFIIQSFWTDTQEIKMVVIAHNEELVEGQDFFADYWWGLPETLPQTNFQALHTLRITLAPEEPKGFSHPVLLNFMLPKDQQKLTDSQAQPFRQTTVARYQPELESWQKIPATFVGSADIWMKYETLKPGYYAMGFFEPLKPDNKRPSKAKKHKPPASGYRTVPVYEKRYSEWAEVQNFKLALPAGKIEVGSECIVQLAGPLPDFVTNTQEARWYHTPEDLRDDIPYTFKPTSDKDAFRFKVPTQAPAQWVITFQLVDPIDGRILAQAQSPLEVITPK